ncbi:integrase [Solibacillus silvestris]|uniref:integrase n=1 Tax=Solibacillus silvestris TaxID=76853 RepID=UPI003F7FB192
MRTFMQQYADKYLHELISSIILATGLNIALEQDHTGVNMSYNFITDIVSFDADRLVEAAGELCSEVPFDIYVKAITLHELGHALDRPALEASLTRTLDFFEMRDNYSANEIYRNPILLSMVIEEHKMNIAFEETAWVNAEKLNDNLQLVDVNMFEIIKKHSLSSYIQNYEEDLAIFGQIHKEAALQPA